MRMPHPGLRVTGLESSLAFYAALGYLEVGRVPRTRFGSPTVLRLPDGPFVSLEPVHEPGRPGQPVTVQVPRRWLRAPPSGS
ncbi:VOC family protein [Nocardiopsis flavescens]|uniref:VOC family protein n=1 Tax=Nocardiopsis flavescens TaxID=758803 RepID=UPI0036DDF951